MFRLLALSFVTVAAAGCAASTADLDVSLKRPTDEPPR